jgi:amidophosphoribosyltransferase
LKTGYHSWRLIRVRRLPRLVLALMVDNLSALHATTADYTSRLNLELDGDTLHEECGVFGILGHNDAAALTALGLHALQHRGQEAAGIVSFDGKRFQLRTASWAWSATTTPTRKRLAKLPGHMAVGHVRYSTTGEVALRNVQPLFAELEVGGIAIAHNGNFTNGLTLRKRLIAQGAICQSTSDTEVVLHLIARSRAPVDGRPLHRRRSARWKVLYAMVAMTRTKLIGARDPNGIRPLVMGELDGKPIFCLGDLRARHHRRQVRPRRRERRSHHLRNPADGSIRSTRASRASRAAERLCLFEYVYFARPDSVVGGRSASMSRRARTWA